MKLNIIGPNISNITVKVNNDFYYMYGNKITHMAWLSLEGKLTGNIHQALIILADATDRKLRNSLLLIEKTKLEAQLELIKLQL